MKNKFKLGIFISSFFSLSLITATLVGCTNSPSNNITQDKPTNPDGPTDPDKPIIGPIEKTDQEIVDDFIASINITIKNDKKQLKQQTLASSINTQSLLEEWFDNLPSSNNEVNVTFILSSPINTNQKDLSIKYLISRNDINKEYVFIEYDFKEYIPIPSQTNQYNISISRNNNKKLNYIFPTIQIYNSNNVLIDEKKFFNPTDTWTVQLDKNNNYYLKPYISNDNYSWSFDSRIDLPNTNQINNINVEFTPINNSNIEKPSDAKPYYVAGDAIYKSEYIDIYNNKLSLSNNIDNKKTTIFLFFRFSCPHSKASLSTLKQVLIDPKYKDTVEVWGFSDNDNTEYLKNQAKDYPPNFKFVVDTSVEAKKPFFDTTVTGVPREVFIDNEGINNYYLGRVDNVNIIINKLNEIM